MGQRRCFIISPIGMEGSATREHADDVFDFIIKPALDQRAIEAIRSDHMLEPGRVTEHMFREILNDDLCIAVITGQNPNVFYELAVAQSAGRPVIVLLQKGEDPPFDIQDLRCVQYDLKPRQLHEGVYADEIVGHIDALERAGWQVPSPFPLPGRQEPSDVTYLDQVAKHIPPEEWIRFLAEAEHGFDLMGISLHSWKRTDDVAELLRRKGASGCRVRIMVMSPDNPVLPGLFVDQVDEHLPLPGVIHAIKASRHFFEQIAATAEGVEFRLMVRGAPYCQVTRSDHQLLVIPYLNSEPTAYSPGWQCRAGSSLYNVISEEFEVLWRANDPNLPDGQPAPGAHDARSSSVPVETDPPNPPS